MTALLTAATCVGERHLVIGWSHVAALRVQTLLESGAIPILVSPQNHDACKYPDTILEGIAQGRILRVTEPFEVSHLTLLGREDVGKVVDRVFSVLPSADLELKKLIYSQCCKLRIPVNTSDSPELSSFTLLSTHRSGDFQMGVTTNGKGCKLAARLKRELAASLPSNIGAICNHVGELRRAIQEEDRLEFESKNIGEHDDDAVNSSALNSLVHEFNMSKEERKIQRTRWLSQVVEYYPLAKLAEVSIDDLTSAYKREKMEKMEKDQKLEELKNEENDAKNQEKGRISLVGAGPGSVSLLTLGALNEINSADLILADKLVPQQVLDVIPTHRCKLFIARKFPGNAEAAQQELLGMGLGALYEGKKVVRLKQGDPYIFGRGGEEYNFFAKHGYTPVVVPGITSALAAPVAARITPTHREVADQVLICTGTGRKGAMPNIPEFVPSRTTVFLMALHRVVDLIPTLLSKGWDENLPCAIVERASCPDQRVVRVKLKDVAAAVEACGSRPPGLLVTGHACEVIERPDELKKWIIEEGYEDVGRLNLEKVVAKGVQEVE